MSAEEDNSTASVLGRIEGGQVYIKETVKEIKDTVGGIAQVQGEHSVILGVHGERLDKHDEILKERAPIRVPWTALVAVLIAAIAVVKSFIIP